MSATTIKPVPTRYYRQIDARRFVRAGAALLDRVNPDWWKPNTLRLDVLAMSSCYHCVLGQLYGEYFYGVGKLSAREGVKQGHYVGDIGSQMHHWSIRHGFQVPDAKGPNGQRYARLAQAWVRLITARRAGQ